MILFLIGNFISKSTAVKTIAHFLETSSIKDCDGTKYCLQLVIG